MAAEGKTGRTRGSEAPYMFESKYFAVKLLGVLEIRSPESTSEPLRPVSASP